MSTPPLSSAATPTNAQSTPAHARIDAALAQVAQARASVAQVILGQDQVVDLTLATILAGEHGLLVGAPGLAKTKLVAAIGVALGLDWGRVQFTPDLMPSDIIGTELLDSDADGRRSFRFQHGPVFTQLLMADEINRASPRTQSALLQAMQESQVTVAGQTYPLPQPFHVLATQNPIEQEGTYPLPEAQLDRFLLQINVGYPDRDTERAILLATTGTATTTPQSALTGTSLRDLQAFVRDMPLGETFLEAVLNLVRQARPVSSTRADIKEHVAWGPGPRAGQALILAAKARAFLRGRVSPTLDDLTHVARPALVHRMSLSWRARAEGQDCDQLVEALVQETLRPA